MALGITLSIVLPSDCLRKLFSSGRAGRLSKTLG
jgi:hypothetical protein